MSPTTGTRETQTGAFVEPDSIHFRVAALKARASSARLKPKIKNGRKFKFGLVLAPLVTQPVGSPVIRLYVGGMLLSFVDPSEGNYLIKGGFPSGTPVLFLSSGGGKADWTAP